MVIKDSYYACRRNLIFLYATKKTYESYISSECINIISEIMSGKNYSLEKILEIEKKISQIKKDKTHLKIRNGLKKINNINERKRFLTIPSPQDVKKEIRIRRRSKEMKSVRKLYEKRLSEFDEKISSLLKERYAFEVQIFG